MKTPRFLVLLLAAFLATLAPRPAQANVEVSFDFFHESLSPYGEWVDIADYGYCWRPTSVDRDWAPYADGYWAFTDAGWTWVSYEEFGGIVYHYGRWVFVEGDGWCWVPDYEWGPAWVSWRQSDDYVGWAPLPPEARWEPTVGLSIWVDRQYDIGPGYYNFCRVRDFGAPVLRPVIVNRIENVTIIRRTVNCTNITYNTHYGDRRVIYNGGLDYEAINRRSERRVPALKLVQNVEVNLPGSRDWDRDRDRGNRDGRRRNFNGQVSGNQLVVTAPVVRRRTDADSFKPKVSKVIAADRVTRGWNGVKNDEVRRELRQEMQRQTKGLTPQTAPARPVAVADLKALPEKADPKAPSPVATRENRDRPDRKDRTPDATARPNPIPGAPIPTAPPEERTADKPMRDRDGEKAPRESQRPVAGQPGLKPFNPNVAAEQRPPVEQVPAATPPAADPRVATPGEESGRMRDGRKPSDRTADGNRPPDRDEERRGEMKRPQADASAQQQKALAEQEAARRKQAEAAVQQQRGAADMRRNAEAQRQAQAERQKAQAEQEAARRKQAEAAAEPQRGAEMQRNIEVQRQQQAERQKMQAEQEKAARQQAEAVTRQKQMEAQREDEGRRQKMQAEQNRAARQQAEAAAKQKQMEGQQRAAQEAARARDSERGRQEMEARRRQQSEQQGAEQQQRRQAMEQQRAAQDAQRQQAERAAGEQQRRQAMEQQRAAQDAQRQQREAQRAAPPAPSAPPSAPPAQENQRRDRGRDRKD